MVRDARKYGTPAHTKAYRITTHDEDTRLALLEEKNNPGRAQDAEEEHARRAQDAADAARKDDAARAANCALIDVAVAELLAADVRQHTDDEGLEWYSVKDLLQRACGDPLAKKKVQNSWYNISRKALAQGEPCGFIAKKLLRTCGPLQGAHSDAVKKEHVLTLLAMLTEKHLERNVGARFRPLVIGALHGARRV